MNLNIYIEGDSRKLYIWGIWYTKIDSQNLSVVYWWQYTFKWLLWQALIIRYNFGKHRDKQQKTSKFSGNISIEVLKLWGPCKLNECNLKTQEEWNEYLEEPQMHLSNKQLVLSQISGISVLRYWNYQDLSNLESKEECNKY